MRRTGTRGECLQAVGGGAVATSAMPAPVAGSSTVNVAPSAAGCQRPPM
ncbi:hypothetical protein [Mycolicibacterium insubricum]|nr:hypothetical protein [Mycolicibacterium insubricum]MCV7082223.1 hypothetical protein [Mycolicibacterium insubricum]